MMKKAPVVYSERLKDFLDFFESVRTTYDFNMESMKNEDHLTQDLLHRLELESMSGRERSKVATQLVLNRQARRKYKDVTEELAPIVDFFEDPKNRSVLNNMKHLLGQVRKMEGAHQRRSYTPKVMDLHKVLEDRTNVRIENAENEKSTPLIVEI